MKELEVKELMDLERTIAKELFERVVYPWEVLPLIHDFILELGKTLPEELFLQKGEDIWIARSARIDQTASITGPCIIDEEAVLRPGAFVRGNVIIGKKTTVGNSTECKNVVLFDQVEVPHYNYVGDSVLGFKAHLGAGAITSNVKNDKTNVVVKAGDLQIETGLRKFGAMLGDWVQVGCNSVLNPGTVIGTKTNIYPLSSIRGFIPAYMIYKEKGVLVPKNKEE